VTRPSSLCGIRFIACDCFAILVYQQPSAIKAATFSIGKLGRKVKEESEQLRNYAVGFEEPSGVGVEEGSAGTVGVDTGGTTGVSGTGGVGSPTTGVSTGSLEAGSVGAGGVTGETGAG
jgi:hypothetical protein